MKVGIIDDEPLARMELSYLLKQTSQVSEIFEGDSIEEAFQLILVHQPDLLFLDIHLTDESGLDLANRLRKVPNAPLIIFATAYDNHAVEAFEVNALDYVLKPFEQERINRAIEKAANALEQKRPIEHSEKKEQSSGKLTIETDERIYLIAYKDIYYCEVQGKETTIYTKKGRFTCHSTLSSIEKLLPSSTFLKVHRAFIINQDEIKEIQPWFNHTYQVTMVNDGKVPVSRSYLKEFKERLGL